MKAPFSAYLAALAPGLKELIAILNKTYDYVSVLSTDTTGLSVMISQRSKNVGSRTMASERGTVVRVHVKDHYSEYALNDFDPNKVEETAATIIAALDAQETILALTNTEEYKTGVLDDEPIELFVEKECEIMPEDTDVKALVEKFSRFSDEGVKLGENIIDCHVRAQSVHVCKMFLSANRDMRQSYVYSEGMVAAIALKDGHTAFGTAGVSGLCGSEIFDSIEDKIKEAVNDAQDIIHAERIVPGEYEIITTPEVTGVIAHEAFGHGVEMDMFVKNRALGKDYIDQRVGSDLLSMHEGALCAENVTSYAFDDEGVLAQDTLEIDHGFLKTGISDALAALRLGTKPTGNGKRQNFEHKVYSRMTNTIISNGTSTPEEMIASVKYGYLLEGVQSGMEDPKHWGIQVICQMGREIKDGKLTGKVVAPVLMTGYVPNLLGNISMVSEECGVFGGGGCGKGYKEWVKVADGGPYIKTKGMLG